MEELLKAIRKAKTDNNYHLTVEQCERIEEILLERSGQGIIGWKYNKNHVLDKLRELGLSKNACIIVNDVRQYNLSYDHEISIYSLYSRKPIHLYIYLDHQDRVRRVKKA